MDGGVSVWDGGFCGTAELKRRSVQGSVLSMLNQGVRWVLNLGAMAILARLLTPEDFGLLAMVYAVVSLAEMFTELGLSTATVQSATISGEQASTLFWLNLGLSVCIGGAVAIGAPALGAFYREPRLTAITLGLSATCPLTALGLQHRALLSRQMRFAALAGIDLVALTISLVAAIAGAWVGLGYWALVIRHYVFAGVTCLGLWWTSGWRPGVPKRHCGAGEMVLFGANLTAFDLIYCLSRSLDKVLLGWRWSTSVVGLYDKAYQLLMLPTYQIGKPLSRVMVPALSRLRDDPGRFRSYYRKGTLAVSSLGMPLVAFTFVAADDVIPFFLGDQWRGSVPIYRVLAPAAYWGCIDVAADWIYAAMGQAGRKLRWGIVSSIATAIGFAIGIPWGAIGMAAALSIVFCGLTMGPAGLVYCFRGSPV
ncbi:MAG: lipopolysaccharide biosynthesis protein, partial [Bacillota bacterium]